MYNITRQQFTSTYLFTWVDSGKLNKMQGGGGCGCVGGWVVVTSHMLRYEMQWPDGQCNESSVLSKSTTHWPGEVNVPDLSAQDLSTRSSEHWSGGSGNTPSCFMLLGNQDKFCLGGPIGFSTDVTLPIAYYKISYWVYHVQENKICYPYK